MNNQRFSAVFCLLLFLICSCNDNQKPDSNEKTLEKNIYQQLLELDLLKKQNNRNSLLIAQKYLSLYHTGGQQLFSSFKNDEKLQGLKDLLDDPTGRSLLCEAAKDLSEALKFNNSSKKLSLTLLGNIFLEKSIHPGLRSLDLKEEPFIDIYFMTIYLRIALELFNQAQAPSATGQAPSPYNKIKDATGQADESVSCIAILKSIYLTLSHNEVLTDEAKLFFLEEHTASSYSDFFNVHKDVQKHIDQAIHFKDNAIEQKINNAGVGPILLNYNKAMAHLVFAKETGSLLELDQYKTQLETIKIIFEDIKQICLR